VPQPPIAICLGGAAEALRLAPVVRELRRRDRPAVVLNVGRRTRMLDDVLETFAIEHGVDLGAGSATRALGFVRPAAILVQADTATAARVAPAAAARGIALGRVEAGTGDRAPLVGDQERRLATWHFAPDAAARDRLVREGVHPSAIQVTGSTVGDAARLVAHRDGLVGRAPGAGARRVLVAMRRGAGRDVDDRRAAHVLARLAERADVQVAIAAPRVPLLARELAAFDNVTLVDGLRYARFVAALADSHVLLTDRPSAAQAAAALGVPALGVGDPQVLARAERVLDEDPPGPRLMPVYGETAAVRIVTRIAGGAADVHSARLAA
jgi:UDP-N-acetylglucosamine 2-epimerase (non-hydrolysing)